MERRLDECADRVGAPAHLRKLNDTKLSRGRPRARPVIEQSRASIPQARLLGNVPGDEGPLAVARHVSSVTLSAILVALRMSCRPPLAAAISDAGAIVPAAQPAAGRNEVRSRPLRPHAQHCASPPAWVRPDPGRRDWSHTALNTRYQRLYIVEARSVQEGTPQLCTPAHRSPGCRGRRLTLRYVACVPRAHCPSTFWKELLVNRIVCIVGAVGIVIALLSFLGLR